jgi:hypothetical protein
MQPAKEHEVLESVFIEMDPILHGFCGVLVELSGVGERYVLLETAAGSGNHLLKFASGSRELAYALFEAELRPRSIRPQLDGSPPYR